MSVAERPGEHSVWLISPGHAAKRTGTPGLVIVQEDRGVYMLFSLKQHNILPTSYSNLHVHPVVNCEPEIISTSSLAVALKTPLNV